jgi:hypothetical protein
VDDTAISAVLEQVGDPELLAQNYAPAKRYLIGPQWYEIYVQTLRRVLYTALPVFATVTLIVELTKDPMDFINAVGEAFGAAVALGIQIVFWVTLVFVLLERSGTQLDAPGKPKASAWTVAQLPEMPKKRQIGIGEVLTDIVLIIGVMAWVALPPILARIQGNETYVSFLNPELWQLWLPLFFVIAALTLVHASFKLKIGVWTPALTVTNVILDLVTIIYIVALVMTQDLVNPAFLAMLNQGLPPDELNNVETWATWTVNLTAVIIIGIYVWDMVHSVIMARRLARPEPYGAIAVEKMSSR